MSINNSSEELPKYKSVKEAVLALRPACPLRCILPNELKKNAEVFLNGFSGDSLYAVKSNPDRDLVKHLIANGINAFDVASIGEVRLMKDLAPNAKLAFMHPVKGREAIREAYYTHGIRRFVIDTHEELIKIVEETDNAKDLTLITRIAMPKGSALCALTGKFGISPDEAPELIKASAKYASKVGVSFHVGSQSLDPKSYSNAIKKAGEIIKKSGCQISVFDVGGGFPIPYLVPETPALEHFFEVIKHGIEEIHLPQDCEIWAEPGRALCGTGEVLVVRVELRKGNRLYINDGSYGNMMEVNCMNWKNKCEVIRPEGRTEFSTSKSDFEIYGATCDSWDHMKGPFNLPADIAEGDWIVFYGQGAYGAATHTDFNGFKDTIKVIVE